MIVEYSIFYSEAINPNAIERDLHSYDLLISAFNPSDRVTSVFSRVRATRKIWVVHPEYQFTPIEVPSGHEAIWPRSTDELTQVDAILAAAGDVTRLSVCIDCTGFMRHVLAFLLAKIAWIGLRQFDVIYSEPDSYVRQEETIFTTRTSGVVRTVRGMGPVNPSNGTEYLILGIGYDHKLISEVAGNRDSARIYPLFSFPSLSPDMYQQSAVRASKSGEVTLRPDWVANRKFAPANDPFSIAGTLQSIVHEIEASDSSASIYLSPLATKVQTLGFFLYWQLEGRAKGNVSFILPECLTYSRETSVGLRRLWRYTIET